MNVSDRLNKLNSLNIDYKNYLDSGTRDRDKLMSLKNEIEFYLDLCENSNGIPESSGNLTKKGVMIDLNLNLDRINKILAETEAAEAETATAETEIDNSELEGGKRRRKSKKNKSKKNKSKKNKSKKNKSKKRRRTNKKTSKRR